MRSMLVALLGLSWVTSLHAEPLPSFLNSNETERNLPAPNLPADAFRPATPRLNVPAPDSSQQQPLLMNTRVQVRRVRIEGGTVYPLSELRDNYQGLLNREVTLAELIEATRRLTQRYQADGYLLSYAYSGMVTERAVGVGAAGQIAGGRFDCADGGVITTGDTQWMTAGAGILHRERPPEWLVAQGGLFHGFQLWVNLM